MMNEEEFGTADDYIKAFEELQRTKMFRQKHVALLKAHFEAPNHTATWTELAKKVNYAHGSTVHLQYGTLAGRVARQLKVVDRPHGFWLSVLTRWTEEKSPARHTTFVLRRPVIEALARLGILQTEPETPSLTSVQADLDQKVGEARYLSREERRARLAEWPKQPAKVAAVVTVFLRNPYVIAEVLARANGVCESCRSSAPFARASDGTPYLEVHHVISLASGGDDTEENAVALCPNCHRREHYG
jgi:hypothetical protein